MPGRMSNRDRIARLAAEKAAERKEKEVKKKKKPRASSPRASSRKKAAASKAAAGPRRLVWLVCDQAGNPLKTYSYPKKGEAEAEAARLSESKGKLHFVRSDKVPMEE